MNSVEDSTYYIEDSLLLKFLITRYSEMLQSEKPHLSPVWKGLGLVGLYQNRELGNAFKNLISSDSYTVAEALESSIDLFLGELNRLEAVDTQDYVDKKGEPRPLGQRHVKKLLYWSWRENIRMRREKDFEFYPIWELISWRAMEFDEGLAEFEETCRFSESPPEEKLQNGVDIVRIALRRAMGNRRCSFQNN